jgi:molybdopterin molybdotransferase
MNLKASTENELALDQALANILSQIKALNSIEVPLPKSCGFVTSEDIYSNIDLPLVNLSGFDGYAVRSTDIKNGSMGNPVILNVVETARAGHPSHKQVMPGTAIRIMTGSVVPKGADCIVGFEDTDEPGNKNGPNPARPKQVRVHVAVAPGTNIRQTGYQISRGSLVIPEGQKIGPTQISALAEIGKSRINVIRKPVVSIITTGDELMMLGRPLKPGKVYNSNALALGALVEYYGGTSRIVGIARDNEDSILEKLSKGLTADAIITSGGVSKGDFDLVRLVLDKIGRVVFSRIRLAPGASFAFGLANRPEIDGLANTIPVFALSGPPSGCVIDFETLVRPAVLKMKGIKQLRHPAVDAIAEDSMSGRRFMTTVKWTCLDNIEERYRVKLNTAEGLLVSMANANSLTLIPEGAEVRAGDVIPVWPLEWSGCI